MSEPGDIDTLANRIAHIRTWTFVSNRATWLKDPEHWQGKTREIEDRLSDAMHEQLTQRFVDRRTSALMKGMRDKDELHAEIAADGAINVENHFVGRLRGFRFQLDPGAEGIQGKATRSAAAQVLARELGMRARRVAAAQSDALSLDRRGRIMWREEELGQIEATDDPLKPTVSLLVDEHLSGPDREKVQARLEAWLEAEGHASKRFTSAAGKTTGGIPFNRGALYHLLRNGIYLGMIRHKGILYPGQHPPIVDPALFDEVQQMLDALRSGGDLDVVRSGLQLVLQALIEMEAAQVVGAAPYQRSPERTTHRNGHRERLLSTKAGDLELRIPKLRQGSFFPSLLEPRPARRPGPMGGGDGGLRPRRLDPQGRRPRQGPGHRRRDQQLGGLAHLRRAR